MTGSPALWLRWSLRDLRHRWVLVSAIALVLALGTGMFAALGSTATWRRLSNDESFARVRFHDLRVELAAGSSVDEGRLLSLLDHLEDPSTIAAAAERLRVPTQVDASTTEETILVRGELVGLDVQDGWPPVDRLHIAEGEGLGEGAAGVLEVKFARAYDLPAAGAVELAGGRSVEYRGLGVGPEEFIVIGDEAGLLGERNWATFYAPLAEAQRLAGRSGQVNDLVVRLGDGADLEGVRADLERAVSSRLPDIAAEVTDRRDVVAFRTLYDDIENDQKVWNVFAALILIGAVFAVFNLVSRVVESQRREIGVGMALGVTPRTIALRPLLLGLQIAVSGTLLGVGVGLLVGEAMKNLMTDFVPLPVWIFEFQPARYATAAGLGLALPLVAAFLPVWSAVRVQPVDAIQTGHLAARTSGLSGLARRIRVPGRSLMQMPLRHLLRQPRRTGLTILAIGAAIAVMISVLGMLDSLVETAGRAEAEVTRGAPDRIDVNLDDLYAVDDDVVARVAGDPAVGAYAHGLQLPATAETTGDSVSLLVRVIDLDAAVWTPSLVARAEGIDAPAGIVLSEKAAEDLGVLPGGDVRLHHPRRAADGGFGLVTTEIQVSALHPDPIRAFAYVDVARSEVFGLGGMANYLQVTPAQGRTTGDVRRALFDIPEVASAQPVDLLAVTVDDAVDEFAGFLRIIQVGALGLALLIAFNAASISVDERAREHATMFAFGVPVRSVLGVTVSESVLLGVAGTALGIAGGYAILSWMVEVLLNDTFPELGLVRHVAPSTLRVAAGLGVAAVAAAPLLATRRLTRMSIPDMLRYLE